MVAPSSAVQVVAFLSNTPVVAEFSKVRGPAPPEPTNVMMSPSSKLEEAIVILALVAVEANLNTLPCAESNANAAPERTGNVAS